MRPRPQRGRSFLGKCAHDHAFDHATPRAPPTCPRCPPPPSNIARRHRRAPCAPRSSPMAAGCRSITGWPKRCTRPGWAITPQATSSWRTGMTTPRRLRAISAAPQLTSPSRAPSPGRRCRCCARQTQAVLEFGAGTGALAEGVLQELDALGLATQYFILKSPPTCARARPSGWRRSAAVCNGWTRRPTPLPVACWPREVLDAMPVSLFCWGEDGAVLERGVSLDADQHFA